MLRILDLFCGVGGVARGFQKYLLENGIEFEYYAVDINDAILLAHRILNPHSVTLKRDAYSFTDHELRSYDFIWASPPCESHSRLMWIYNKNQPEKWEPPDKKLWQLIERLYRLGIPFVVENVRPYYRPPMRPTSYVCRHALWSNLSIPPFDYSRINIDFFEHIKDDVHKLVEYHELNGVAERIIKTIGGVRKARDALRDMVHHRVSYEIAKRVIPQILDGRIYRQTHLTVSANVEVIP